MAPRVVALLALVVPLDALAQDPDEFPVEAIPEGPTLLLLNHDRPGVVGHVGTVLGEEGCNISRMQLALVRERGEACMLLNVDTAPPAAVLERLRGMPHMITAQLVEL